MPTGCGTRDKHYSNTIHAMEESDGASYHACEKYPQSGLHLLRSVMSAFQGTRRRTEVRGRRRLVARPSARRNQPRE